MNKKAGERASEWLAMMRSYAGVILMGHHLSDYDALGCIAGMTALAREAGVPVFIAPGLLSKDIEPMVGHFAAEGMPVISEPPANVASCVIVVGDTQQPAFSAHPDWLPLAGGVAVIDHHLPENKAYDNPVLRWVNTRASSTSELVSLLLSGAGIRPTSAQADFMLTGIMLDTRRFSRQATKTTFRQAARLCEWGARVERARTYFEDQLESYIARSQVVHDAVFVNSMAFSLITVKTENTHVIAAQAADDMISLRGINAAFVAAAEGGVTRVSIRAREGLSAAQWASAFGGGGTNGSAGFQIRGITPEQAIARVRVRVEEDMG